MKKFKNLVLFLAAVTIALGASAQATTTTAKTVPTSSSADKVDASQKGPHGETVYIGPKDGHYYKDKTGKKVYLKSTTTATTKATTTVNSKSKTAGQKPSTTQVKTTTTDQKMKVNGATTSNVKTANTTTKSSDKVNSALHGPNGQTVYTGSKGGNYYLDKTGKKVYLKK